MSSVDALILDLIATGRRATPDEVTAIVQHVAQAPFASYLSRIPPNNRAELVKLGVVLPPGKMRAVAWHLLKRIYLDEQWPLDTTEDQLVVDLHQAILHPEVEIRTYRYSGYPYVGFMAPSHVQDVPDPKRFLPNLQEADDVDADRDARHSIHILLRSYDLLIGCVVDLATEWSEMEEEEKVIQQALLMSDWGNRHTLGELYMAGRLTEAETQRLAELDQSLLQHAASFKVMYSLSLGQLISRLAEWGTPLTEMDKTIQLAIPGRALPRLAEALAEPIERAPKAKLEVEATAKG